MLLKVIVIDRHLVMYVTQGYLKKLNQLKEAYLPTRSYIYAKMQTGLSSYNVMIS